MLIPHKVKNKGKYISFHYLRGWKARKIRKVQEISPQIPIYTYSITHSSFPQTFFSSPPLRKLIFGHYILSFPLFYHTSSGIAQITFLNAPSKSPYKQMQSLTRNNHITSNHLSSLALILSKHISAITFFITPPFHAHLQPHSCKKNWKSNQISYSSL